MPRRVFTGLWPKILFVLLLTMPAMVPFLRSAQYWESHDGLFHLYRLLSLEAAWRQGYFYPRIFPDFAFGYGFAVLNFYGPLTYYLALFLRVFAIPPIIAMKLTYALSYPLAALGAWWLARDVWHTDDDTPNEWAGIVAAVVYTYVPYHLADVQLRGALAESWAFVWWCPLFWALWRGRFTLFMLSLAALVLTHNLSVVLVAFPLAVWLLLAVRRAPNKRAYLVGVTLAGVGALLLTAFYWLPVVLESRYVAISQDIGTLGFASHLQQISAWFAASADYRYFPNQGVAGEHPLSWAQVALLGGALMVGVIGTARTKSVWWFGWGVLLFSVFFLTTASYPLWERLVFPFGLVQYPWRWLGMTAFASALVVSGGVAWLPARWVWVGRGAVVLLSLWLMVSGMQNLPWVDRAVDVARHPVPMWQEDAANGQVGATWTAEFLPRTVKEQRWALARAPEQVTRVGETTSARIMEISGNSNSLSSEVMAEQEATISLSRYAYPSMQITQLGGWGNTILPIVPQGNLGIVSANVPAGISVLSWDLYPLANQKPLDSVLGLLPVGVLGILAARRGKRWVLAYGVGVVIVALALWVSIGAAPAYAAPDQGIATIGEQAQLVAWKAPTGKAGQPLHVSLMWFNLRQTDQNFVTFLHLTPLEGGAPLAQHDSQPNMDTIPTTRWLPGELVEDLHLLNIPDTLAPGTYGLWAGMYQVRDGQAAPIDGDSGERRFLGTIEIEQ